VPGLAAAEHVRESIVDPEAYMGDGCSAGLVVTACAELLTEEQIDSLVDALLDS
jgi:hypothetical protein